MKAAPVLCLATWPQLPLGFPGTLLLSLHSSHSISVPVTEDSFILDLEPTAWETALCKASIRPPPHPFMKHFPHSEPLKLKDYDLEPVPGSSRVIPSHSQSLYL